LVQKEEILSSQTEYDTIIPGTTRRLNYTIYFTFDGLGTDITLFKRMAGKTYNAEKKIKTYFRNPILQIW